MSDKMVTFQEEEEVEEKRELRHSVLQRTILLTNIDLHLIYLFFLSILYTYMWQ